MLVTLKLYHCVHDMLEDFRSSQCAFLVYVANEYDRYSAALCES